MKFVRYSAVVGVVGLMTACGSHGSKRSTDRNATTSMGTENARPGMSSDSTIHPAGFPTGASIRKLASGK